MQLLTDELRAVLPKLYGQEKGRNTGKDGICQILFSGWKLDVVCRRGQGRGR